MQKSDSFSDIQECFTNSTDTDSERFKEWYNFLKSIVLYQFNDIGEADLDDVIAQVTINLWQKTREGKIQKLRSYAFYEVKNVLKSYFPSVEAKKTKSIDDVRSQKRILCSVGAFDLTPAQREQKERDILLIIEAKEKALDDMERDILFRRYEMKMQVQDIAEELGMKPNTVSQRIARAELKIKNYCSNHE